MVIKPNDVRNVLTNHLLTDGYELIMDLEKVKDHGLLMLVMAVGI